jgi:ribosomal protein S18 acetylase RimI-like enzyme
VQIRLARPTELAAVGDLTVAAYDAFTLGPEDPYVTQLRDAAARAREAELWVAADGERVLGAVTSCPEGSPWREVARPGEGEFRMLAVHPDAQGRGAGEALVRHVLDRWTAAGTPVVVLSSLPQMTAAHRLYGRLGFRRTPERDWDPVPGVHLVTFRRDA